MQSRKLSILLSKLCFKVCIAHSSFRLCTYSHLLPFLRQATVLMLARTVNNHLIHDRNATISHVTNEILWRGMASYELCKLRCKAHSHNHVNIILANITAPFLHMTKSVGSHPSRCNSPSKM